MRFPKLRTITTYLGVLAGLLMCAGVAAQGTSPKPLTGVTFSSPFINIGGSPQNIFVTPVPSDASLSDCAVTSPASPLATYNPTGFFGPMITVSAVAAGTMQAVQHTFNCGLIFKTFVVKPPTYPADILLSGSELKVGETTQNLTVTPSPSDTVLPTCSITGTPVLSTVTVDRSLGTVIALTPSADAITADTRQTVTCGSLSKTFTVKAKVSVPLTDFLFSSPFINIGGSPQNIFVTPVPAEASLSACSITSPATPLATYNPANLLGPTLTISSSVAGTTAPVTHTLTCGQLSKTFVVKPSSYPADIALSGSELTVGSNPVKTLTASPLPAGTVLPICSIMGTPVISTVTMGSLLDAVIELTSSADAITADTKQTLTCGTLSKTFTVKPKEFGPPNQLTVTGADELQTGARTTLTATARYADNRQRAVNPVWSSSNPVVASVSAAGVVTAGVVSITTKVTVSASWTENGVTVQDSHVITVSATRSVLTDLTLTGPPSVQSAGQVRLVVNAVYADLSSKSVSASFTLSNPALGSVNNRGVLSVGTVLVNTPLTVTATYEEGGVTKTASFPITISAAPAVLSRLTLVGLTAFVSSGQTLSLSALGEYSDTSSKPVTATWRVSGTAATVSSTGVFQASSVSTDTPVLVSASYREAGVTVDAQLQVVIQPSVPLSPIEAEVQVTGTSNNFSLAVWTSFNNVASASTANLPKASRPVYKLFVVARIPGGQVVLVDTIATLNRNSEWQGLSFPVAEYLNGVSENSVQLIQILDKIDVSIISGSRIFVGYGIDDLEMLASGRFKLFYQIQ